MKAYRAKHGKEIYERQKVINSFQPEKHRAARQGTYQRNKEKKMAYTTAYRKKNPELYREASLAWAKANPGKVRARNMRRHAAKMRAVPAWADRKKIAIVYEKAVAMGLEVDHVVPLRSPIVCGLHVWENLQLLCESINIAKGNRHWPDMPEERL
jgi:5-methylcytosine-specific restriction endonuclease McrA